MNPVSFVPPIVNRLELHISGSPLFTSRAWARKVKDLGGTYSECRSVGDRRTVELPNTAPGRRLAADLLAVFPEGGGTAKHPAQSTVIFRDVDGTWNKGEGSANRVVFYVKRPIVGEGYQDDGDEARTGQADAILDQITERLRWFEKIARVWWDREGRAAAEAEVARRAASEREVTSRALSAVAPAAVHAFERGQSRQAVLAAVEAGLFRAASHAQLSRGAS